MTVTSQTNSFSTDRLLLVAATLEHIEAELKSTSLLGPLLNAEINKEWPPGEYDKDALEYFREKLLNGGEELNGWLSWYAIKQQSEKGPAALVAAGGFFGPPSESGDVEIGYSVIPSYRQKGYASEIVDALIRIAKRDSRVKRILARTAETNKASSKVLERNGFSCTGILDEEKNIIYEKIVEA